VAAYPSWNKIDSFGYVTEVVRDIKFSAERVLANLECLPGPGSVIRAKALGSGRVPGMTQMGDLEQWIRLCRKGKFVHIDQVLASWRKHDANMSLNSFGKKNSLELNIIRAAVEETLNTLSSSHREKILPTFEATWNKLKAISEIRVPGSFKSVSYLFRSLTITLYNQKVRMRHPWTVLEVVACLLPFLARHWINFVSKKQERSTNHDWNNEK
jgi:hypothetical protein